MGAATRLGATVADSIWRAATKGASDGAATMKGATVSAVVMAAAADMPSRSRFCVLESRTVAESGAVET